MFTFINTILISSYTNDRLFCNTTHTSLYGCLDLKVTIFLPNIAFSNILTVPNCTGPKEIQQQQLPILHACSGEGHQCPHLHPSPVPATRALLLSRGWVHLRQGLQAQQHHVLRLLCLLDSGSVCS